MRIQNFIFTTLLALFFFGEYAAAQTVQVGIHRYGGCASDSLRAYGWTTGGTSGPYTYNWSNGSNNEVTQVSTIGTYTCTMTNTNNGATGVGSYYFNGTAPLLGSFSVTPASCGQSNGAIDLTITGGDGLIDFISWSNGEYTEDISNLAAGLYSVYVSDSSGCSWVDTVAVGTNGGALVLTDSSYLCDSANSWITTYAPNGQWPYTYQWSNGATTDFINSPIPGATYSVTLTDANGCTGVSTFNIPSSISPVNVSYTVNNATCGQNNGAIDLTVSGGSGTYTYYWYSPIGGTNTQDPTGLAAGTYRVWVSDTNGCGQYINNIVVGGGNATISINATGTTCGGNNGSATATVTGLTNPMISWSNNATGATVNNLSSGYYTVMASDSTCSVTDSFYIAASAGLTLVDSMDLCDSANTWITAYSNNGQWPYTYQWSDGSTSSFVNNPTLGTTYSLTLTDANGCTGVSTFNIPNSISPVNVSYTVNNATCGQNNGAIDLTVSGGSGTYTYYWYNPISGVTTQDPTGLAAGTYAVWVQDANGCGQYVSNIVVGGGNATININATGTTCGGNNGSATATVTGLTNPMISWSNNATGATVNNLSSGYYTVMASDSTCTVTDSFYIAASTGLTLTDSMDLCDSSGTNNWISTRAYNGQWPYSYQWSDGSTNNSIFNPTLGATYSVTIIDANGCIGTSTINVPSSISFISASYVVTDATCGQNNGAIDVTVSGGGGTTYNYYWSHLGQNSTQDQSNLAAGTYSVYINSSNGCWEGLNNIVVNGGNASIAVTTNDASCGLNNGSATATITGLTNPMISWSNGATTATINNLSSGYYTVMATDSTCTVSDSIYINNSGIVNAAITPDSTTCPTTDLYSYGWGGASPYSYLWSNGATTSFASGLTSGTHTVTVTDANGCTDTANYFIQNTTPLTISSIVTDANCGTSGAIDITVAGGSGSYSYWWNNNMQTEDLSNLSPGVYNVWVYDNTHGCSISLTDTVDGQSMQVWDYISPAACSLATGSISIYVDTVDWMNPTYNWSTGDSSQNLNSINSGWYGLTITDGVTGCIYTDTYYVPEDTTCQFTIAGYVRDISTSTTCQYSGSSPAAYEMVKLQPLGLITFTNAAGYYSFNVTTPGNYTVEFLNAGLSTVQCPATNSIAVNNATYGNFYGGNNFYITNPPVQDLRINLYHWSTVTPGFRYYTAVKYYNDGNNTMNGTVTYQYDAQITYDYFSNVSSSFWTGNATLLSHDVANRTLTFSVPNLAAGEQGKIYVYFDAPTTAVLGNTVTNVASITPITGDITPSNNTDVDATVVVGSWDPNDKQVSPYHTGTGHTGGIIYLSEEELEYTIRFQNTGTAAANRVVIRDALDNNLDINTIRDMSASHDISRMYIDNGSLVVEFNNINLPDSGANFAASNGYVQFTVNRTAGLPSGTQIHNSADIYFDFNAPVITNTVTSTIETITSTEEIEEATTELEVQAMPNPFNEQLTVQYTLSDDTKVTIELYNVVGERVRAYEVGANKAAGMHVQQLPTNYLPAGMYLLRVETDQQVITKKVIKD